MSIISPSYLGKADIFMKPSKYKLVFSDIDGTLLDKHKMISEKTSIEIKRVTDKFGVKFILISARMPRAMRYLQKELNINTPLICYNGALVLDEADDDGNADILEDVSMPHKVVDKLYKKADELDLHIGIYSYDDWHVNKMDEGTKREIRNTQNEPNTIKGLGSIIKSYKDLTKSIHKMMCIGEAKHIDKLHEHALKKYKDKLHIYRSKDTYLELAPIDISKKSAIQLLHKKYKVSKSEVMAFGDNYNDVEMLKYVGMGIAVANAKKEVRKAADYITKNNLKDGVAIALSKYF